VIKADIVRRLAEKLGKKDKEALELVDEVLECMKDILLEESRLELREFGVFAIKTRKGRTGRNPKNKIEYPIPQRRVVTFRPGKIFRDQGEALAQRVAGKDGLGAQREAVGPALDGTTPTS